MLAKYSSKPCGHNKMAGKEYLADFDFTKFFNSLKLLIEKAKNNEEDVSVIEEGINNAIECLLYIEQQLESENVTNLITQLRIILQDICTNENGLSLSVLDTVPVIAKGKGSGPM